MGYLSKKRIGSWGAELTGSDIRKDIERVKEQMRNDTGCKPTGPLEKRFNEMRESVLRRMMYDPEVRAGVRAFLDKAVAEAREED